MNYQSEIIKEIIDTRGHGKSSLHYESECIESWIDENNGSYPKLCDYQSEWLNYINENPSLGEFPYETLIDVTNATINNVVPYAYKSAILKGNTLVNRFDNKCYDLSNWNGSLYKTFYFDNLEVGKEYVFYAPFKGVHTGIDSAVQLKTGSRTLYQAYGDSHGTINVKFTLTEGERLHFDNYTIFGDTLKVDYPEILILESKYYYDGISFFTGMKSVQMPVLTTTGENVFSQEITDNGVLYYNSGIVGYHGNDYWTTDFIEIEPNKNYSFMMGDDARYCLFDENKIYITGRISQSFNTSKARYVKISGTSQNLMLVYGTEVPEIYKPYKSIILTVNEDVTLRSNGSVYDALDLLTGKLTQRIDEDGSVLTQEVVKTVELTITNQDGETLSIIKPLEGTMHITTSGTPINPLFSGEIPVEAITQNLASFIKE